MKNNFKPIDIVCMDCGEKVSIYLPPRQLPSKLAKNKSWCCSCGRETQHINVNNLDFFIAELSCKYQNNLIMTDDEIVIYNLFNNSKVKVKRNVR